MTTFLYKGAASFLKMRLWLYFEWMFILGILFLTAGLTSELFAQSFPLSRPDVKQEGSECRVKVDKLKPLIDINNPFFYNHNWDEDSKMETAQLTPERLVFIEQFGCMRHHTQIKMLISKEISSAHSIDFYIREIFFLIDRLNYFDVRYLSYREDLERTLSMHVIRKGFQSKIAFPLLENTYFLWLEASADGSAVIIMEIVKYVHEEQIQMPGIKEYLDDGYFKGKP